VAGNMRRQPAMSSRVSRQGVMADPDTGESLLTGGPFIGDVAQAYGFSMSDLRNDRRFAELVEARREVAHRLFWEGHLGTMEIGRILNRHRSTVHYYIWGKA